MKRLIKHTMALLLLTAAGAAGTAYAQSAQAIRVKIPFDFSVGDKTFPAGSYSIMQPAQHYLWLRDELGRVIASTFTSALESATASPDSKLIFRSVDGQKVLTQFWRHDTAEGEELPNSTNTKTRYETAKWHSNGPGERAGESQLNQP
jgi:hypothetical protein